VVRSKPTRASESVSIQAVEAATHLVGAYFLPMAERVYGDAAIPLSERAAMTLARSLRRLRLSEFNARDMRRHVGGKLRESASMHAACAALTEAGLIRPHAARNSGGGRPAQRFEVNPALHASAVS
jgi:hypothetical protein